MSDGVKAALDHVRSEKAAERVGKAVKELMEAVKEAGLFVDVRLSDMPPAAIRTYRLEEPDDAHD